MSLLRDEDRKYLEEHFVPVLENEVRLRLFTESPVRSMLSLPGQEPNPQAAEMAKMTRELIEDVASLSPKLRLEVLDARGDGAAEAKRLGIEQLPALVMGDDEGGHVRFYGAPVGNEFPTILGDIQALSTGAVQLREPVAAAVREHVDQAVHLRVFVTPT
jgi:hypothetical protein